MANQNHNNSPSPLSNLRFVSYCPLCNTHYNPSEAKLLDQKDGAHLIHVECRSCGSSILAVVITGGIGISSVGLVTDLIAEDVLRFKGQDSLSEDDVLAAYELLRSGVVKDLS